MLTKQFLAMPVLAMLTLGTATPGLAQTIERESRSIAIKRADLLSPSGRVKIETQIAATVRRVCEPLDRRGVLYSASAIDCRIAAMADARSQLDQRIAAASGGLRIAATNSVPASR